MREIKIVVKKLKSISRLEFTLDLEKDVVAIAGSNGSGKSTLLTCIAKLVKPSVFKEEFRGDFNDASVSYYLPCGLEIEWKKAPNWYAVANYDNMPKIKGFLSRRY